MIFSRCLELAPATGLTSSSRSELLSANATAVLDPVLIAMASTCNSVKIRTLPQLLGAGRVATYRKGEKTRCTQPVKKTETFEDTCTNCGAVQARVDAKRARLPAPFDLTDVETRLEQTDDVAVLDVDRVSRWHFRQARHGEDLSADRHHEFG